MAISLEFPKYGDCQGAGIELASLHLDSSVINTKTYYSKIINAFSSP
jgi:hypothetical protein